MEVDRGSCLHPASSAWKQPLGGLEGPACHPHIMVPLSQALA